MSNTCQPATLALRAMSGGDGEAAKELLPFIYSELRALAAARLAAERVDHTLQPTALVHEAYLKLIDQSRVEWQDRRHFFAVASEVIRRILVDHARTKKAAKRGGDQRRVGLDGVESPERAGEVDFADIDEALKELAALNERQARIVELRFFGGMEVTEVAALLGVSERTVVGDWKVARAWLQNRLGSDGPLE